MKALFSAIAIALFGAISPGLAADTTIPREFITLAEYQGAYAPNRLDLYDVRRELARDAEHMRIHARLGDPPPGCWTVAGVPREDAGSPYPRPQVIVCR